MPHRLFSTKPISELHEADESDNELNRTLDARALVLLGIGAIIGTGIFVLTGTAAANHAGPALVISFLIAGLGCALAGLLLRRVLGHDPRVRAVRIRTRTRRWARASPGSSAGT